MYNLFSYPDRKRMRVSQVLVLPPFQRQGVGRALLQSVYALADSHTALDVTVHSLLQHAAFIIAGVTGFCPGNAFHHAEDRSQLYARHLAPLSV